METIRVNVDFETELFLGQKASPKISESLEFLAFFLDDRPVYSRKNYSHDYLSYVERITGKRPKTSSSLPYKNWWGEIENLEEDQWLNSKLSTTEYNLNNKIESDLFLLQSQEDLLKIQVSGKYLAKNPFGMSGQNFSIIESTHNFFPKIFPIILEPLLERRYDFSHYVFPDGKVIAYQNLVDSKFQYKGTIFNDISRTALKDLSFYSEVASSEWDKFSANLEKICKHFYREGRTTGFSIDSFIYIKDGALHIRALSEINYRRTMGSVAYEIALKLNESFKWNMLYLSKPFKKDFSFLESLSNEMKSDTSDVIVLSPGDTRFDVFLLMARNQEKGIELLQKIQTLTV